MNIVVPMSGRGKRFSDAGYSQPKPFITVNNYPMIHWVIENLAPYRYAFEDIDYTFTFICLKEFIDKYGWEFEKLISKSPVVDDYNIVTVDQVTDGALCSVLLAKDIINNDDEVVISDCDHLILDYDHIGRGVGFFRKKNVDGGIWCFLADSPKWSYVRIRDNLIRQVVEKEVVSNLANTGSYYFRHGKELVKYAEMMIRNKDTSKGEYYVAPVYNYLINNDLKVIPFLVNEMISLGTPNDLKAYLDGTI